MIGLRLEAARGGSRSASRLGPSELPRPTIGRRAKPPGHPALTPRPVQAPVR
jgi:hypothetical protein